MAEFVCGFFIIILGYLYGRRGGRKSDVDVLNRYTFKIFLPSLIFVSLVSANFSSFVDFILFNLILVLSTFLIGVFITFLLKMRQEEKGIIPNLSTFGNIGYLGIPLISLVLGKELIGYAGALVSLHGIVVFTLGITWLELMKEKGRFSWGRIINPVVVATVFGVSVNLLNIGIPPALLEALRILGNATFATALLSIGLWISFSGVSLSTGVIIASFMKLVVQPSLVLLIAHFFPLPRDLFLLSLIEATTPSGIVNFVIAKEYETAPETASPSIIITTLLFPIFYMLFLNLV